MPYREITDALADELIDEIIDRLEQGEDMRAICKDPRMPGTSTLWRWSQADDELGKRIVRAREIGYYTRADEAVENAKAAQDAGLGRLAFDAERWRLSKLAKAFADKVIHAGDADAPVQVTINKP